MGLGNPALRALACALSSAVIALAPAAFAKGGGHGGHSSSPPHGSGAHRAPVVTRDAHGRIARSVKAKDEFRKSHPCPSTGRSLGACPGYVIDHVQPLKRGGSDAPNNMQWQTTAAAKAKDRWE